MKQHKPVLLREVLEILDLQAGQVVVDGTFGAGGHAMAILEKIGAMGRLIALDQDESVIQNSQGVLKFHPNLTLHHTNFNRMDDVLKEVRIKVVDRVLLDIGLSSDQLADPARGFSFDHPGPLDMRMDQRSELKASDLVNHASEQDLEKIFRQFGEEKFSGRFARSIVSRRPISTTQELVQIIEETLPPALRFKKGSRPRWARRHPATLVFQALRIAVNRELEVLTEALPKILVRLKKGGRLAVISFHSLEDRIVKRTFQEWSRDKKVKLLTKKPIQAAREEEVNNPRSRSAKLRAVERL